MRDDKTKQLYVVLGKTLRYVSGKSIDNHGMALKMSYENDPTLQVRGSLTRAINAAQKLIMQRRNSSLDRQKKRVAPSA